jgi:hypothetical protein
LGFCFTRDVRRSVTIVGFCAICCVKWLGYEPVLQATDSDTGVSLLRIRCLDFGGHALAISFLRRTQIEDEESLGLRFVQFAGWCLVRASVVSVV